MDSTGYIHCDSILLHNWICHVERLENRYLSMLRKRVLDSSLSLKERTQTMDDYVNALLTLEKIEDGRIKQ